MNAFLTPQATAAIKAANAQHIARNDARRRERAMAQLMRAVRQPVRDVPAFKPSGLVRL